MTRRPLPTSIGLATLGLLALPLYAVQRYPWRDPMGARASWAIVVAYLLMLAGVIAAVFFGG